MRRSLFEDKELVSSQKEKFYIEVKRLNQQTSELKNFIRYRCGNRGIEWYQRLEMRKQLIICVNGSRHFVNTICRAFMPTYKFKFSNSRQYLNLKKAV